MLYRSPAAPKIAGVLFAEDFGEDDDEQTGSLVLDESIGIGDEVSCSSPLAVAGPTAEEIEEGRRQAREEGFNAGLQAARCNSASERLKMLECLDETLKAAFCDLQTMVGSGLALVADTLLIGLVECLPALCKRHGISEMKELVRSLLPALEEDSHLIITVHPDLERSLYDEIEALGLETRRITIASSERMLIGDITVKWDDGSASRDISRWQTDMVRQLIDLDTSKDMRGRVQ